MESSEFSHLRYEVEVDQGVALVTLAGSDGRGRNAWSGPMSVEYRWALHHAHEDPDVRVVVVTGSGDTFCVGADTRALDQIGGTGGSYDRETATLPPYPDGTPDGFRHNHTAPLTLSTHVICVINGSCAGAGFVLATYADFRWARSGAKIATSFASFGLPAEYGIGWMLPRIIGTARALELLYEPGPRTAEELQAVGFIQRVLPGDVVLEDALSFARRLARHSSPNSLRAIKRAVLIDADGDFDTAYRRSVVDMDAALRASDFKTGVAAARSGTRPEFLRPDPRSFIAEGTR
jgi:enoyl-CoA hydratase/carnithine racemase